MKLTTRRIAFAGILAAVYAALTWLCQPLSYGAIQFRFSEALIVFCCFTPAAIPGMVVGCLAANIATTLGLPVIDIVFGSLATLLASVLTRRMSRSLAERPRLAWLVPLPNILCNAVIVGAEIAYFFSEGRAFLPAFGYSALTVGLGEAVVMYALGVPLLLWLRNSKSLERRLREI